MQMKMTLMVEWGEEIHMVDVQLDRDIDMVH
jgi:hypothetical protein